MAPIQKTHRRAQKELNELNEWFSDILDDQSHFMRYVLIDFEILMIQPWRESNQIFIMLRNNWRNKKCVESVQFIDLDDSFFNHLF